MLVHKNILLVTAIFLLAVNTSPAQNSFDFLYHTFENERLTDGFVDSQGNAILCGNVGKTIEGVDTDGLIMKVYPNGNYKTRIATGGESKSGYFKAACKLDSSYLFIGRYSDSIDVNAKFLWIYETDTALNVLNEKTFLVANDKYTSLLVTHCLMDSRGDIVIAGYKPYDLLDRFADIWFCKLNSQLDTIFTKTLEYPKRQYAYDFTELPAHDGYMVIGGSFDGITSNVELFRVDTLFNKTGFTNVPKNSPNEYVRGPEASSDMWLNDTTMIITVGVADTANALIRDNHLGAFKVDTSGTILNKLIVSKPDTLEEVAWLNSLAAIDSTEFYMGGFVTSAIYWSEKEGYYELYLIDTALNLLGYAQYGGDAMYCLNGILSTPDGGCLMYGDRYDSEINDYERDIQIVKFLREDLEIYTTIQQTKGTHKITVPYPNPVHHSVHIPLHQSGFQEMNIQIFTIKGKKVLDKPVSGNGNVCTVEVNSLPGGTYLYYLTAKDQTSISGKFIKTN